jgi:hypothetical protein
MEVINNTNPTGQKSEFTVPSDIVKLPSKGLFYPNRKAEILVEYMTARDENILTAPNLLSSGRVFDVLMKRKIKDNDIDIETLLQGDMNKILIFLRKTAYGKDYEVRVQDPLSKQYFSAIVDLEKLEDKFLTVEPDERMEFSFSLPLTKKNVKFRLLNNKEKEQIIKQSETYQQKLNIEVPSLLTDLLKGYITEIDGNRDRLHISNYVEIMSPLDATKLRKYIAEVEPGVDMTYEFVSPTGNRFRSSVEFGLDFFWLDYGN